MPTRMLRNWTSSEKVDALSFEAEVFFTRLIMTVDDFGRFYANPKLLKSALFPLRDISDQKIEKWLHECQKDLINVYEVDKKSYLEIIDFNQRLRLKTSKFPGMPVKCPSNARQMPVKCPPEVEVEVEVEVENLIPNGICEEKNSSPAEPPKIDFEKLLEFYNQTFGKRCIVVNEKVKAKYKGLIKQGYTTPNIARAMEVAKQQKHHIDNNFRYLTLEFFSRSDKVDMYAFDADNPKKLEPYHPR